MHTKDYNMVARVCRATRSTGIEVSKLIFELSKEFKKENKRFNQDKFFATCGYPALSLWLRDKIKRPVYKL